MTEQTIGTYALSVDWVDAVNTTATTTITNDTTTACWDASTFCYPSYYSPWLHTCSHETLELKMSEIERLRLAAQDDKKLKKILKKFTPFIKVVVDFD